MEPTNQDRIKFTENHVSRLLNVTTIAQEAIDKVIDILYTPLTKEHTFGVEPNGTIDYKANEMGGRKVFVSKLTPEHNQAYLGELDALIDSYIALITKNRKISSSYPERPIFEVAQAEEMTINAFKTAFDRTKSSYSKIATDKYRR